MATVKLSTISTTLINLISCVININTCAQTTQPSFILYIANGLLGGILDLDGLRNGVDILKSLNRDIAIDVNLAYLLTSLQEIIATNCSIDVSLQLDLYNATLPLNDQTVLNEIESVAYNTIVDFETSVGTLETTLLDSDLNVGIKVLSKLIGALGLTSYWDEILQVLTSPNFVNVLTNSGNAFKTGEGIIDALNTLLNTLLSRNFFIALSDLLDMDDLSNILSSLLKVVMALVVDVVQVVELLLLVVVQLLGDLIPILESLVLGL